MARRKLNSEELSEIANKDWKKTPIFTSNEKLAKRAKNLTGPRTVEGKMKALANLQVGRNSSDSPTNLRHGGYVRKILNEDEQEYYFSRQEAYLKDIVDINNSADEIILHTVLMEEVILMRLYKKQADSPSADIERPLNDCSRRLRTALEDLGALRKQRLKQDDKVAGLNIAVIAQQFARELMQGSVEEELRKAREEEEQFLLERKSEDINDSYVIVEEDDYDREHSE